MAAYLGMDDVEYEWRGSHSDPVLHYKGHTFSVYYIEDALIEEYRDECEAYGIYDPDDSGFDQWLDGKQDEVREYCEVLIFSFDVNNAQKFGIGYRDAEWLVLRNYVFTENGRVLFNDTPLTRCSSCGRFNESGFCAHCGLPTNDFFLGRYTADFIQYAKSRHYNQVRTMLRKKNLEKMRRRW